ncbi:MAG: DoxX family protein [Chitinophagaceae bacterium]
MKYAVVAGRFLFSLIFLVAGIGHFSSQTIAFAGSQGVPFATVLVPLSGVISILGGLSILIGYKTKLGAWLLIVFLVPVTLMLHKFWTIQDPMMKQMDIAMFMKNLGLLGGAFFIAFFGAGPLSIDERMKQTALA